MKRTALYDEHVAAGARMVDFAGYMMPIQYTGIIEEHNAVRKAMGIFDLSHMGEFKVTGENALAAVDRLVTNDICGMEVWQIKYTPMCYPDGGIVDDLLVYRFPDHLMLVVNAANIDKDLSWVQEHLNGEAQVENISDDISLIAVQGPRSHEFLQSMTQVDLSQITYYHFATGAFLGADTIISRTGYTGEDGFELYVANADAPNLWRALVERGTPVGLKPVGLGARDTLRLEAGYMLYGNDIDQATNPLEAGLGWTVKFGEHDFIGREALERAKAEGLRRRMVAVQMQDRGIPRQHYPIEADGTAIGELTSGSFSPSANGGIGLGYVDTAHAKSGTEIEVEIRGKRHPAQIVRKPIYKREGS